MDFLMGVLFGACAMGGALVMSERRLRRERRLMRLAEAALAEGEAQLRVAACDIRALVGERGSVIEQAVYMTHMVDQANLAINNRRGVYRLHYDQTL